MTNQSLPVIKRSAFNQQLIEEVEKWAYAKNLWPVVYILNDGKEKEAYVGETTDLLSRMSIHLKNDKKKKLGEVCFIANDWFNKSATLDIESNLIKYISGDGQFELQNGNIGLANHNYYQKPEYWNIFRDIWHKLRAEGIAKHAIEHIDNSNLFKYSPYKNLTKDQHQSIIELLNGLLNPKAQNIILEGGAGTGKTVLAIFLFKLLNTELEDFNFVQFGEEEEQIFNLVKMVKEKYLNPRMALVIPMTSFRETIKKVFKNAKGLDASMVVGPSAIAEEKFDIIVVDEAHRLRRRVTLGPYFETFDIASSKLGLHKNKHTELDWVVQQAEKTILFYDKNQSIKPSDVQHEAFLHLKRQPSTIVGKLSSQLRVRGGNDYVSFLDLLLNCSIKPTAQKFNSKKYELFLFESIADMIKEIKHKNEEIGLSRVVAGYAWPWTSKKDKTKNDIHIDNTVLKWNSTKVDWVNSQNAIDEAGCIHTTQGYDLNFAGIIIGNEISYDESKNEITISEENYHDRNGKIGVKNLMELKAFILNIYKTLMLRGIQGTYLYACDKNLQNYLARHIKNFKPDPIDNDLSSFESSYKDNLHKIPFFDLEAAAGTFSQEQKVEDFKEIPLPPRYKSGQDLFACTVKGESMNKVIPSGAICLFRRYTSGSRDGKIVLVELTGRQDPDSGSVYTVKEYHSRKMITENGWAHQTIELKPLTNSEGYESIQLRGTELEILKVVGVFECVLKDV